jgi:hypothetical protein
MKRKQMTLFLDEAPLGDDDPPPMGRQIRERVIELMAAVLTETLRAEKVENGKQGVAHEHSSHE